MSDLLGQAYDLNRAGHRREAVVLLRQLNAEQPDLTARHFRDFKAVVDARGRRACHVSSTMHDLLREALHA